MSRSTKCLQLKSPRIVKGGGTWDTNLSNSIILIRKEGDKYRETAVNQRLRKTQTVEHFSEVVNQIENEVKGHGEKLTCEIDLRSVVQIKIVKHTKTVQPRHNNAELDVKTFHI